MDVEKVLGMLRQFFDHEREPLVVVGGLAMLTYGATRNTYDCDLLVRSAVRPKLRAFLEAVRYKTVAETPAFSNYLHRDLDLGRLDVLYVDDDTARQVFAARRSAKLGASLEVAVPSPDHLIAMKTQSLRTDPERRSDVGGANPAPMKPFLNLTAEDLRALEVARKLPPPPIEAILKMSRQLAPVVWDAVRRRPLPRGSFSLPARAD